ncbi:rRNA maturation RNase YbeY [Salibaculum griseiflavum]|uniref:Endoribonuclease YbeY n=1 Tax=Salibaculum griseiflavum TaxID=1914409 RepID=A0A2V1P645_9RHOB|nr:rRNA maturation RNase YbeY [Salibaculum griseiflavum]PWG17983.1 rRNA maturation RNase YbeY [Salibaculum griseiflavum]
MIADVMIEAPPWEAVPLAALAERAVTATLSHLGLRGGEWSVAILACDDARIAELNGDFRAKPQATNVLSWPNEERGADEEGTCPEPPDDPELGDIAIAYETCQREAVAQGKSFDAHVTHLIVHATLHLLGYDHERDGDATLMEALEVEILGKLGLPDPYS